MHIKFYLAAQGGGGLQPPKPPPRRSATDNWYPYIPQSWDPGGKNKRHCTFLYNNVKDRSSSPPKKKKT